MIPTLAARSRQLQRQALARGRGISPYRRLDLNEPPAALASHPPGEAAPEAAAEVRLAMACTAEPAVERAAEPRDQRAAEPRERPATKASELHGVKCPEASASTATARPAEQPLEGVLWLVLLLVDAGLAVGDLVLSLRPLVQLIRREASRLTRPAGAASRGRASGLRQARTAGHDPAACC